MIGDPQSIKAFKTSITPENVKFFWASDRICSDPYHFAFSRIRKFAQVFSCQFSCSYRRGNTSENLSSRHFISFHLHHNLCRIAFLSESFNVYVGNCNLLSGMVLCSDKGPERGLQTRLCDRVISAKGSELEDVANEVFAAADDDSSVQLALQNCLSESEHHALTQGEVEEEAVLWANLKRNLANKALVCLHTLSIDVTDRCCNGCR